MTTHNDSQWDLPTPFTLDVTVQSQHIDGLKHTNNAVYVQWCEQIAWRHSESLGLSLDDYQTLDRAMAIRHSEYDYQQASFENEKLIVATWLTRSEGINMERRFQVVRASNGQTLLRGRWQLVCIQISTGKPKRPPAEFVKTYGPVIVNPDV